MYRHTQLHHFSDEEAHNSTYYEGQQSAKHDETLFSGADVQTDGLSDLHEGQGARCWRKRVRFGRTRLVVHTQNAPNTNATRWHPSPELRVQWASKTIPVASESTSLCSTKYTMPSMAQPSEQLIQLRLPDELFPRGLPKAVRA